MLNESLFKRHLRKWVEGYGRDNPDVDVDAVWDTVAEVPTDDFDAPADAMESLRDSLPSFYKWWHEHYFGVKTEDEADAYAEEQQEVAQRQILELVEDKVNTLPEDTVAQMVRLMRKNPDYLKMLEKAVDVDGSKEWWNPADPSPFQNKPFGWNLDDVEMTGGHLQQLLCPSCRADPAHPEPHTGVVYYSYHSNQYKHYRLTDPKSVRAAIDNFKEFQREAKTAAKIQERIGIGFLSDVVLTDDDVREFERLVASGGDMLDYWFPFIAPKIVGVEGAKKSVLLTLVSLHDIYDDRNRIHTLLWGDPETAKTQIAREVARMGGGWADHNTSDVGLIADASGADLTAGLLPRNHFGGVGIDELDKFASADQNGVLESMETGFVSVNKGKFIGIRLPAEAVIVATANVISGFRPELVSRFDFKVHLTTPTVGVAQDIMKERIEFWNRPKGSPTLTVSKFVKWCRGFVPDIPDPVRKEMKGEMERFIRYSSETRIRSLERLIRIALAIARLNHRDVEIADFKRAIELVNVAACACERCRNGGKPKG